MQDRGNAELDTEAFGVTPEREQGVSRYPKQQSKDELAVEVSYGTQLGWQRRDDMEMLNGQDALLSLRDPFSLG